ncbi:hypothetical protein CDL60_04655 [Roseateles noduli]|nr:hypothetical protein CDL60_04655 [Roseateles noduli]
MSEDEKITPERVERRIRNYVLDWLDMVVVIESVPPPFDLNEVLNQWDDYNPKECRALPYPAPAYTEEEADALKRVIDAVDRVVAATPQTIVDTAATLAMPEWTELDAAARRALAVMSVRGKLPD